MQAPNASSPFTIGKSPGLTSLAAYNIDGDAIATAVLPPNPRWYDLRRNVEHKAPGILEL